MSRFADALNRAAETIKRPPPLPVGTYNFRVTKTPDPATSIDTKVGKMEKLTVNVAVVEAIEVDDDEIAEFGDVANQPSRLDFLFSEVDENAFERTLNRFKMFCEHCGIDVKSGTMGSWMQELANAQFGGEVGHRIDPQDDTNVYAEIKRTSPAH
jgi:hypothetical protein